jgi:hypothetical protein
MNFKRFRAQKGQEVVVSSTLGHMFTLSDSFQELPEVLWSIAYSVGAISEDMKGQDEELWISAKKEELKEKNNNEREQITSVLKEIFEEPGDKLTKFGIPKVAEVTAMLGWKPEQNVVSELWEQITKNNLE